MKRDYHIKESPIPDGFQIYEERLEVAGFSIVSQRRRSL